MTTQPTDHPCLFHLASPCQNLKDYSELCAQVPPRCEHILKATLKPGDVEFFVMMDSNCYNSPAPCPKPEAVELRMMARWEAPLNRNNHKYKKLTCDLKSLDGDAVSFPNGRTDGLHSILSQVGPLYVFPDYPQAATPVCDNKSVTVEKKSGSALRRVPVEITMRVWKDEADMGNREQDMILRVAVPPGGTSLTVVEPLPDKPGYVKSSESIRYDEHNPVEVFIAYAREDAKIKDSLVKHLTPLQNEKLIASWHDGEILPGREWDREIKEHLDDANIILLLVSVDFIVSGYIRGVELKRALERHKAGEARVIPLIIRDSDWSDAEFAMLQALPPDAKPIVDYPNEDKWFTPVIKGLRKVVEELHRESRPPE